MTNEQDTTDPKRAARLLCALIWTDLDVEIEPHALAAFVKRRWARIAPLAHAVHETPDMTKGEAFLASEVADRVKQAMNDAPEGRGYLSEFPMEGAVPTSEDIEKLLVQYDMYRSEEIRLSRSNTTDWNEAAARTERSRQRLLKAYRDLAAKVQA